MAECRRSSEANDDENCFNQNRSNEGSKLINQHLTVTNRASFKWYGTFEGLQAVVNEKLGIQTKWTSPRGGLKLLENDGLSPRWYSSSSSLIIKGKDGDVLKEKLCLLSKKEIETNEDHETLIDNEDNGADREAHIVKDGSKITNLMRNVQSPADQTLDTFITTAFEYLEDKIENLGTELNSKVNASTREVNNSKERERLQLRWQENEPTTTLRAENQALKEENEAFKERIANLSYIMSDLHTKVKDNEDEKQSLITALKSCKQICSAKWNLYNSTQPGRCKKEN